MNTSIHKSTSPELANQGFAKFNSGDHLCVEMPQGHNTISVKTADGKLLTFAFLPDEDGKTHCVDIMHHTAKEVWYKNSFGESVCAKKQDVVLFGNGSYPDAFNSKAYYAATDKPIVLTTILLGE